MRQWIICAILYTSVGLITHPTQAQTNLVDTRSLLERLEQQELRIHELESRFQRNDGPYYFTGAENNADVNGHAALHETLAAQADEIAELKSALKGKPDAGHSKATMKIVGRVHADYWGFPGNDSGIDDIEGGNGPQNRIGFRRVRFGVRGKLPANMEYRIEMEFAGGNDSEFRDVWLGWNDLPVLQKLLIGNQKRPYGLDHLNSSRYNVFLERPFVIESFNQDCRRVGVQSWGVSRDQGWNWRYGVFNQRLTQDEGNYTNDDLQLEFAGRLARTFWYDECSDGRGYGHWAISGTTAYPDENTLSDNGGTGPDVSEARFRHRPEARSASRWLDTGVIAGAQDYQLLGTEAVLNFGPVQLVGEYENVWLNRTEGDQVHIHGGYLYVSYFLTGEHMVWNRKNGTLGRVKPHEDFFLVNTCNGGVGHGWGAWQVAARWSEADFNDEGILGGMGQSITLGLNWYWTAYARVQLNWIHGRIDDRDMNSAKQNLPVALRSGDYDIIGTRFMVDF